MLSEGTASSRPARKLRITTGTAIAAILTLASGTVAGLAPGAQATGDDGRHDVTIPLSERTADELTDGANRVVARGAADKDVHDGQVYLSLPMRKTDHRAARGDDGSHVARLAGAIAYTGAGPDIQWGKLQVNYETGKITTRINGGPRVAVLRVADGGHDGHRARGGDAALRLTKAGARSLNRAAQGAPFSAGDVYAKDSSGCS